MLVPPREGARMSLLGPRLRRTEGAEGSRREGAAPWVRRAFGVRRRALGAARAAPPRHGPPAAAP